MARALNGDVFGSRNWKFSAPPWPLPSNQSLIVRLSFDDQRYLASRLIGVRSSSSHSHVPFLSSIRMGSRHFVRAEMSHNPKTPNSPPQILLALFPVGCRTSRHLPLSTVPLMWSKKNREGFQYFFDKFYSPIWNLLSGMPL